MLWRKHRDGAAAGKGDNKTREIFEDLFFGEVKCSQAFTRCTHYREVDKRVSEATDQLHTLLEGANYIYRNPKITADAYAIVKNIESEYLNWDSYSSDMINGYVHMLFTLLCRNRNYYKNERTGGNIHVEKILNDIKSNYHCDITLSRTAREHSISPEHLSRIFKKETGLSFHEYLTSIRLKEAERLLKLEEKKSVSEIAFSCGFNDSNYFSHKFKTVYGLSPLQFQKRCR